MRIELGYACINTQLPSFKRYTLGSLNNLELDEIQVRIWANVYRTAKIIEWNIKHKIKLYRLTSDLIPLATHPDFLVWSEKVNWHWWKDPYVLYNLNCIRTMAERYHLHLTTHLQPYSVLNSDRTEVVEKTYVELLYHQWLMDNIGGKGIIMHVGSAKSGKDKGIEKWINNYNQLPQKIQNSILLENDDKSYTFDDVMKIARETNVLPLFDFHHHRCNSSKNLEDNLREMINMWDKRGRGVKVHLSTGKNSPIDVSHADYVEKEDLKNLIELFKSLKYRKTLWIMLECKKKEKSIEKLREEWNRSGNKL